MILNTWLAFPDTVITLSIFLLPFPALPQVLQFFLAFEPSDQRYEAKNVLCFPRDCHDLFH